jgi:hypothetical protein
MALTIVRLPSSSQLASYLTQASASATYLTQSSASSTYANLTTYRPSFRNAIINGKFDIWQRGTSFSNPSSNGYLADRFVLAYDGTGATRTISQQAFTAGTAPVTGYESQYFLRYNVSAAGTGNTFNLLVQRMEDVRTFANQTITISAWLKADSARNITVQLLQNFGSGGSAEVRTSIGTASVTTSWTRFTFSTTVASVTGKTIGTSSFLGLEFWNPSNTTFTVDFWGVQVEGGTVATPFEQRPIGTELALCQRYYWRSENDSYFGTVVSTGNFDFRIEFPVEMRGRPLQSNNITAVILTISPTATQVNVYNAAFTVAPTTYGSGTTMSSKKGGIIRFSGGSGGTNGFGGRLLCGTSVYFDFDAEL